MVCAAAIYIVVRIVRSEAFARRAGALSGRLVRWGAGVTKRRPTDRDFEEATLRFRDDLRSSWKTLGLRVTTAVIGTYVTQGVIFGLSLRATGLGRDAITIGAIAVVYTIVRLATIVNFTPGGVGVTEALYTSALLAATGGEYQSADRGGRLPLPRADLRGADPARRRRPADLALPPLVARAPARPSRSAPPRSAP